MRRMNRNALTLVTGLIIATFGATPALAQTIITDNAFEVFGIAGVGTGSNDGIGDMKVGDTFNPASGGSRGVARFSLAGLAGQTLLSATLNLTIIQSRRDQNCSSGSSITDNTAPFINPGLGDTNVKHIGDPGTPDANDYGRLKLGALDPGTLIAAGVEPPSVVSIDVTAAMQAEIDIPASFVAFRIQTAFETDSDGCNDVWFFATEENATVAARPFILFTTPPPPTSSSVAVGPCELSGDALTEFNSQCLVEGGGLLLSRDSEGGISGCECPGVSSIVCKDGTADPCVGDPSLTITDESPATWMVMQSSASHFFLYCPAGTSADAECKKYFFPHF